MCACVRACVCACVCACVRACVHACVCGCVCVVLCACVQMYSKNAGDCVSSTNVRINSAFCLVHIGNCTSVWNRRYS